MCLKTLLSGDYSFTPYNGKLYFNFQCICTHQRVYTGMESDCQTSRVMHKKPQFTINDFPFFIMTDRVKPHLLVIVCAPWDFSAQLV